MNVHVKVTDSGELQVTTDGVTLPPLPVEVVQAMAAKVDEATAAAATESRTAAVRVLTDILTTAGAAGSVDFAPAAVTAEVDDKSFGMAQEAFGVTPDINGDLHADGVVVRKGKATL